jgi:hypothetical protein
MLLVEMTDLHPARLVRATIYSWSGGNISLLIAVLPMCDV